MSFKDWWDYPLAPATPLPRMIQCPARGVEYEAPDWWTDEDCAFVQEKELALMERPRRCTKCGITEEKLSEKWVIMNKALVGEEGSIPFPVRVCWPCMGDLSPFFRDDLHSLKEDCKGGYSTDTPVLTGKTKDCG